MRSSRRPRATSTSRSLATRRLVPTSAGIAIDAARQLAGDPAAVDDGDHLAGDAVAGEPGDLGHRRVEVGEHLQRAVAEHVAPGARGQHRLHERTVEHPFVAPRDPDRHRLGLVLDRVDGPGQLLDRPGEGEHEIVDQRGRRTDLARLRLVLLHRSLGRHAAQQPGQMDGRARLEVPVVAIAAQAVDVLLGVRADLAADPGQDRVRRRLLADRTLDDLARLAERQRRAVDGERGLVAEEVTGHRREHEPERRIDRRHRDHRGRRVARVAVVGDHDRRRLVGPEDRHLLAHVVGRAAGEPGRADDDQRLRRQVDVLLVLGDVAGDRLVAELAELDPHLLGRHLVRPVADHRPVALGGGEPAGGVGDRRRAG